jgi:hypothetical protein
VRFAFVLLAVAVACGQPLQSTDAGTDAGVDAGCASLMNTSTVSANVCPINDLCPDCVGTALADGLYFQTKGPAVFGSACGSCVPTGTLRIASGVLELVSDEASDICNRAGSHSQLNATFTVAGDVLHLHDRCGAGDFDWRFGTSADGGQLEVWPVDAGGTGGGTGNSWDPASLFQRQ